MLTVFDYIFRSKTGSELYASLKLKTKIINTLQMQDLGVPYTAIYGPCRRCWVYDCKLGTPYCTLCHNILDLSENHGLIFQDITLVWYSVLDQLWSTLEDFLPKNIIGHIDLDYRSGLIMCYRKDIQSWLQDLVLVYGENLKGMLEIFPTMGQGSVIGMGDILSTAKHEASSLSYNKMWIRFYPESWQLLETKKRHDNGILTFSLSEFIAFIEKANVFKGVIPYRFRSDIYDLIVNSNLESESYYWGKLKRSLNKKSIDLIDSWQLKSWNKEQLEILYELSNYSTNTY